MAQRPLPTAEEVRSYIRDRRNWGRWGKDDQVGAINLITPAKRVAATRLVKSGRSVSLSRPFPKEPGINEARARSLPSAPMTPGFSAPSRPYRTSLMGASLFLGARACRKG